MPKYTTEEMLDLNKTIAQKLLENKEWPWQALAEINEFILRLGETLPKEKYTKIAENLWVAKSASIAPSASLTGPCIIDENAEIRHCAYIRGNVIVGKGAVVGNSTELKNCILFDEVQVPHFNYVGDSILGYKAHMGAGVITANVKGDKSEIAVKSEGENTNTNRVKMGAILGDYAEIGCNTVLCPGTIIGKNSNVYPTSLVRGTLPANSIFKKSGEIITKKKLNKK